jgi:hypothetical protein
MSFKEIKELRQAGKLEDALQMANQAIEAEPDNIWNKRAIAWVYYEFLKKNSQPATFEIFKENLIKIKELQLPEDELMVFDNCAWQIGSIIFSLQKSEPVDYAKINQLFDIIRDFHFSKPSESYSFLYKAFHKGYQNWSGYLEFADWWDFGNFRPADYLKEEFNGKKIMAMAEQAYIAYSKKLLEGEPEDLEKIKNSDSQLVKALLELGGRLDKLQKRVINKSKVNEFLPKLNLIIEKHPEFQYPQYFKAKLLLAVGENDNILSAFLPFARQKRNDFWVWELMAEIFANDKEIEFACYCKALSLNTPEDFLVKLRQTFARLLADRQMFNEAKTEIEQVIATRSKHEWKLPNQISQWVEQDWYKSATVQRDNKALYNKHVGRAEEILFQDIPEEIVAVEFVNENKMILNFVQNHEKHGFFKYHGMTGKPRVGDVLKVRFSDYQKDGFCQVLTIKAVDSDTICEAIKNFEGEINIIPPHNIGFVDNVFIEPRLVQTRKLSDRQHVAGKAILSYNKKKEEWGWKAFFIE